MGSQTFSADKGLWDDAEPKKGDAKLIDRIQKRYQYMVNAWKKIWDQAELDQRALSVSGPWTDSEIEERRNKRPCIHLDQLSQHIAFLVNNVRSNPLAIKVEPANAGADNNTSDLRSKRIRSIEYECNAAQAYWKGLENAASNGFGAFGVTIDYKSWDSMQRSIKVRRFANPYSVMWDPDCQEIDWSDMKDAFVLFHMTTDDYEAEYGDKSLKSSFGTDLARIGWDDDNGVQMAEYWYVEKKRRKLLFLETPDGPRRFFGDEIEGYSIKGDVFSFKDGTKVKLIHERMTDQPFVRMCITNGVEIKDKTDWPGKEIPVIPVVGRERYVKTGNKVDRELDSYIRMARDGQKLFDYYVSNEAEAIGMTPKIPYVGYKGQFSEQYWDTIHKEPRAYAEVEPVIDPLIDQLLPLPQRQTYEPPVQALEIGKESTRRSIQAAVASYGVTRHDDTNIKSGVALQQIQQQNDLGSYHFVDNYKIAIRRAARIINDLLDDVEPVGTDVSLRNTDETQEVVTIGGKNKQGVPQQYSLTDESQHEVTLATGPSYQSQAQEVQEFCNTLVANLKGLPVDPMTGQKLLALSIKLKNLGPVGDEIVQTLDPSPEDPEQQLNMAMKQLEQINQVAEALSQKVQELEFEKKARADSNETQKEIAALKAQVNVVLQQMKDRTAVMLAAEQMTSNENIAAMKADADKEKAQVDSQIKAMEVENKAEESRRKSEEKSKD